MARVQVLSPVNESGRENVSYIPWSKACGGQGLSGGKQGPADGSNALGKRLLGRSDVASFLIDLTAHEEPAAAGERP